MVLAVILAEAVLIALAGGALGISLAVLSCNLLRRIPVMFVSLQGLYVTPAVGVVCLAVAASIGVVSAAAPAWSASRRAIVQSLRFTD
jgi:ABC-type antimicrobial peptide transport system permease subunit